MSEKDGKNWGKIEDINTLDVSSLGPASGISKRIIFGPDCFWEDWAARHFIIEPGNAVSMHSHDWEHLSISLAGHGAFAVEGEPDYDMPAGSWARIPAGVKHSFKNIGDEPFVFLCIVPTHGDPHALRASMRKKRAERKQA